MQNISQIRAANALKHAKKFAGQAGGDVVKGYPMLILTNGLLAVGAMSLERKEDGTLKQQGAHDILAAIADHLQSPGIAITNAKDARTLIAELVAPSADAALLRRATAETVAFLSYLKRFAT
jgi:CRISPR/Cas system CMR-associated protein Cmr5 small subunit